MEGRRSAGRIRVRKDTLRMGVEGERSHRSTPLTKVSCLSLARCYRRRVFSPGTVLTPFRGGEAIRPVLKGVSIP